MTDFCIAKPIAEEMKKAVQNGDLKIDDLLNAKSSEDRRAIFGQYMTEDLAKEVNTSFEKALASSRKNALTDWAKSPFGGNKTAPKSTLDKINELEKMGALGQNGDGYLSDLVADKLGVSLKPEEVKNITDWATELQTLFEKKYSPKTGNLPTVDYWVKLREMNDYINSLNPSPIFDVLISNVRRGNMLTNLSSPVVNFLSNAVMGGEQAVARRLAQWEFKGSSGEITREYLQYTNKVYWKTGFDLNRMEAITEQAAKAAGETARAATDIQPLIKGEQITHAQGPGPVRAVARWQQDFIFSKAMNDTPFASLAKADSINLGADKLAAAEGKTGEALKTRANEIALDAIQVEPVTPEGQWLKAQGTSDALTSTWNNKGAYAGFALGIRQAVNKLIPKVGDFLFPFMKTSADVIEFNIDAAGAGFGRGIYKFIQAKRAMNIGNAAEAQQAMREGFKHLVDAGLGMTGGLIIASMINPEDFVSQYDVLDQKESQLATLKNAPANSIKVGDTYSSLDYLGPFAASTTAWLYVKKYGNDVPEKTFKYLQGGFSQVTQLPGAKPFSDAVTGFIKMLQKKMTWQEAGQQVLTGTLGEIGTLVLPGLFGQLARATDPYQRFTGKDITSNIQSTIPGWREQLPPKVNEATGKLMTSEGWVSTLLFGSRIKTATSDDPVMQEIQRLYDSDSAPALQNIEKASPRVADLKKQISPERFTSALQDYGKQFNSSVTKLIKSRDYIKSTDEEKQNLINDERLAAMEWVLQKYHYKAPKK